MSSVELDFFGMEKQISAKSHPPPKLFDRRRSFRDIQSAISKINPELLKTVIASGNVNAISSMGMLKASKKSYSVPSTPNMEYTNTFQALPVNCGTSDSCSESRPATPAPLTIFYNGTVTVFDVPPHKAENIIKLAQEGAGDPTDSKLAVSSNNPQQLLETLDGDLPIARKKSLHRFLEKRKERLTLGSPYDYPTDYAVSCQKTSCE